MPSDVTTRGSTAPSSIGDRKIEVSPGEVIAGRYILEEVLGEGGMGVVVAARHEALGHRVAMKLLASATTPDADAFIRFSREARIVASLENDHVVRVLDYGMHAGTPYMVMELLAGRDLGRELALVGPMPIEAVADHVIQACDGLSVAHAKGIVHRDVKLANLFLATRADGERVIKILDFGVSKLAVETQDDVHLTRTTSMLGSPLYMSPEQIRDPRQVDARADVWSLGVVMYTLITNQAPFTGLNANAVCAAIAADPPASLAERAPQVPAGFAAIVLRCLEKQPALRYENVAALARELAPYASARGKGVAAQLLARAISDGILPAAEEPSAADARTRPRRRSRVVMGIGAACAVVAVAALAMVWKASGASSPAAALRASSPATSATETVASRSSRTVAPADDLPVAAMPAIAPSAQSAPSPSPSVAAAPARRSANTPKRIPRATARIAGHPEANCGLDGPLRWVGAR